MGKLVTAVVVSLLAGISLAAWYQSSSPAVAVTGSIDVEAAIDVEDRLLALEAALQAEREARQLLEDELLALYEIIDGLGSDESRAAVGRTSANVAEVREASETLRQARRANASGGGFEQRNRQMVDAGFSKARAEWILMRESELRMQAMQARYEAMREGTPLDPLDAALRPEQMLRNEIGDAEYERYLEANNRPTAIDVARIMESSPALAAGLQAGDRITHYDGARVYNTAELTRQTMQGEAGENVLVSIVRDGVPMQVVMPRGPLGIMAGRGR